MAEEVMQALPGEHIHVRLEGSNGSNRLLLGRAGAVNIADGATRIFSAAPCPSCHMLAAFNNQNYSIRP